MREKENDQMLPDKGSSVTPEEQRRIEESGREFQEEKARAQASREKKPEGRPFEADLSNKKILEGQQKRILRAKINEALGPKDPMPADFAEKQDLNDYGAINAAKRKKFFDRVRGWFR